MAPVNADATVIILDVGCIAGEIKDKADQTNAPASFFDRARECVVRLIERKIFSRPTDLISVILMGSKQTNNELADVSDGSYANIEVLSGLVSPNWQLIRDIVTEPSAYEGDCFEALLVAASCFVKGLCGRKVSNKKIVLITHCKSPAGFDEQVEQVIEGFKSEGYELDLIGPDLESDDENNVLKGKIQLQNETVLKHFVEETNGITSTLDDALAYLAYHRKKSVKPVAWNVDLSIGSNIKIPVSAYGRIRDTSLIGKWKYAYKDPESGKASSEIGSYKKTLYTKTDDDTLVEGADFIKGYEYGQTIIPYQKSMNYNSGAKCLALYGFTPASNITWQNLIGDGVTYVFGKKGDQNAQSTIQMLVKSMKQENVVGIARKVYCDGRAPTLQALFPIIEEEDDEASFYCLSMITLAFEEDIKDMAFPPINNKKFQPTDEQVDAIKNLIDEMDLSNAYNDCDDLEAFPMGKTVGPSLQYLLDCMAYRALHPDAPLPKPRDAVVKLLEPPPSLIQKFEGKQTMEKLFPLKLSKRDKGRNFSALSGEIKNKNCTLPNVIIPDLSGFTFEITKSEEVTNIGTQNPVGDFYALLQQGKKLQDISAEVTDMIETLVYLTYYLNYEKPISLLKVFRQESLKISPDLYNSWLAQFKKDLVERYKLGFLEIMRNEKLDLITVDESSLSLVTAEEVDEFNAGRSQPHQSQIMTELHLDTEDMDYFDMMM